MRTATPTPPTSTYLIACHKHYKPSTSTRSIAQHRRSPYEDVARSGQRYRPRTDLAGDDIREHQPARMHRPLSIYRTSHICRHDIPLLRVSIRHVADAGQEECRTTWNWSIVARSAFTRQRNSNTSARRLAATWFGESDRKRAKLGFPPSI